MSFECEAFGLKGCLLYTRNVFLSIRGRASWVVKSIVMFISSAAFFFSEEAALLVLSLSLLLASLSFFSSSVSFLLLSLPFLFLLSNLALWFPALSDSPGRFLYNLYPLEKEDAKQSLNRN